MSVRVTGLAPGKHGFNLHEYGDTTNGCISTGAHFNPNGLTHGSPEDDVRHAGDLGNIVADAEGILTRSDRVDYLKLIISSDGSLIDTNVDDDDELISLDGSDGEYGPKEQEVKKVPKKVPDDDISRNLSSSQGNVGGMKCRPFLAVGLMRVILNSHL